MKFRIGDRVEIKENTRFHMQAYDRTLKKYLLGTITSYPHPSIDNNDKMWVRVLWDNNYQNHYPVEDLIYGFDLVDKMLNIIEKHESE